MRKRLTWMGRHSNRGEDLSDNCLTSTLIGIVEMTGSVETCDVWSSSLAVHCASRGGPRSTWLLQVIRVNMRSMRMLMRLSGAIHLSTQTRFQVLRSPSR